MPISLNTIRAAILAKLRGDLLRPAGPVSYIGDIRGEPSVNDGGSDFEAECADPVSLLVQYGGDQNEPSLEVRTQNRGLAQQTTRSTWRVYAVILEDRDAEAEAAGSPGAIGMHDLIDAVRTSLTGLRIASPAATLAVRISGTPSAVVTWPATARLVVGGVSYAPAATGATLDSFGLATINAAAVTPGALGNQLLGTTLTWNATPADLNATGLVTARVVDGASGLWRAETLRYVDTAHRGSRRGSLAVQLVRFSALHGVQSQSDTNPRSTSAPISIDGDVDLAGGEGDYDSDGAPNPLAELSAAT